MGGACESLQCLQLFMRSFSSAFVFLSSAFVGERICYNKSWLEKGVSVGGCKMGPQVKRRGTYSADGEVLRYICEDRL